MTVAKLNLVILAAAAAGMLWVEHSHRIKIEASAPAEVASRAAAVCPENESVPFSTDCMMFIDGGARPDIHLRLDAAGGVLADSPELP
jgi:hypothetical protein